MGKLEAALHWAARGFRVFPLQENSRDPLDRNFVSWTTDATTDADSIKRWWTDPILGAERNWNIGVLTTGLIVPDVDIKAGKAGLDTFSQLGMDFDTLTVRTPSGGYHLYYRGDAGQSPLGQGIDVRSRNGYVLAPGSTINGCPYEVEFDLPIADFPERLRRLLKPPRERAITILPAMDLDTPEAIETALHYLQRAPPAIEGQNGDNETYRVACRLRDIGLSEGLALSLMLEEFNPRCEPPWLPEELARKIANAYQYATGVAGSLNSSLSFAGIEIDPPPPFLNGYYPFGEMVEAEDMGPRPWIMRDMLLAQTVTSLIGAGGAGKSIFALTLAAHLACGKPFMGAECVRPGCSIIYDAEDSLEEMSRRMIAICRAYGLPLTQVRPRVALVSGDERAIKITTGDSPGLNSDEVQKLIHSCAQRDVQLLILNPLISIHTVQESDNTKMEYVMSVLRMVAKKSDVGVLAAQHTAKPPVAMTNAWVGSQFAGRGASSVPAASRTVMTMFGATAQDCIEAGIPAGHQHAYVRVDVGKANFAAARGKPAWLKWETIREVGGDSVGVLQQYDAGASEKRWTESLAAMIAASFLGDGHGSMTVGEAIKIVRSNDPVCAREDDGVVRNRLLRMLNKPVKTVKGYVAIRREGKNLVVVIEG